MGSGTSGNDKCFVVLGCVAEVVGCCECCDPLHSTGRMRSL